MPSVKNVSDGIPVFFETWDEYKADVRGRSSAAPAPLSEPDCHFCPTCWNQRKTLVKSEGGGYVFDWCMTCLARGVVPSTP